MVLRETERNLYTGITNMDQNKGHNSSGGMYLYMYIYTSTLLTVQVWSTCRPHKTFLQDLNYSFTVITRYKTYKEVIKSTQQNI